MTAAATSRPAGPAVGALAAASGVVLAALPVGMALANRSAPASLVVAGLLAVAALAAGPGFGAAAARARALVERQTTRLALVFAGLALLSLLWSVDRARSLRAIVELAPVLAAGLALVLCFPALARPWLGRALAGGIAVAATIVMIEAGFALPWRRLIGARLDAADLKRAVTPLAVLLWPVIPLLPARGRAAAATLLGALAFMAALAAHSGAAMFGLAAGAFAFALVHLAPRLALAGAAIATTAALSLAPLVGALLHGALPMLAALERFHAHHRILIWQAFGERAAERPVLGHGFGAIDKVWSAARPAGVPADAAVDWVIENIHAHNQPLQVWVELGGLGATLAGLIAAAVVARLWPLEPARLAPRLAAFVAALAVALVGFGAWQAWWIATVAAALALFAADAPAPSVGEPS